MIRFLVLVGYLEMTMYLQLTGKLDQYINSHYTYLTYMSMVLAFILAIVQLTIWMRRLKVHSHLSGKIAKLTSPLILAIPVMVALFIPTVTLDSTTVSAKGYYFPTASGSDPSGVSEDGQRVQYLKPDTSLYFTSSTYSKEMQKSLEKYQGTGTLKITSETYMEIMELIYLYPSEFVGRDIEYVGFVYNDPVDNADFFAFRFGVIHCIADSGVYGLMIKDADQTYSDNTWVKVKGQIVVEYNQNLQQTLPVLHVTDCQQVNQPDNAYVYRVF
ncbi:TIGR03943 family putative permease subunit [Streptococcus caprae]|uniref:TIGR03943 family putative permease subunit n=1 Tax=Streptococcus caprae TaxID=1640501 RepID=A0ABV8CXY4_9STRE